jgi:GNAT superfamily N-acetyltransferase
MTYKFKVTPSFLECNVKFDILAHCVLVLCEKHDFYFKQLEFMFVNIRPNTYNLKYAIHHKHGMIGFNIFEYHGDVIGDEEQIISSQFLFVDPKHRNKGIATELLKLPDICDNPTYRVESAKSELRFFDKQGYKFKRLSKTGEYLVLEK